MAFPYRRILNPFDLDENSMEAVEVAAAFARQNDGAVILLHVISAFPIPRGSMNDTTSGLPTHTISKTRPARNSKKSHASTCKASIVSF